MGGEKRFILNAEVHLGEVMEKMFSDFSLVQERMEHQRLQHFDSFDWRLYKSGCALVFDGGAIMLQSFEAHTVSCRETARKAPRFAQDLPAGSMREKLTSMLKMRALIHRMTLVKSRHHLKLLDKNEKTVLRIILDHNELELDDGPKPQPVSLTLKPLRGYGSYLKTLQAWVLRRGGAPESPSRFESLLREAGQVPLDYQPKPELRFRSDERADHALKQLLAQLIDTMEQNEPGISEDVDSEFLHDFRVAVRRTRSAIGQLKGVLPVEWEGWARTQFALLGSATNDLRDLDVYLLEMPRYRRWVPAELAAGLVPFSRGLRRRRSHALRKVKTLLHGPEYTELKARWLSFLAEQEDGFPGPGGAVPIEKVARKAIGKRFSRIARAVATMTPETPEEAFHRLRIQCKKLRYLLEFFESLFPKARVIELVAALKRLQKYLGTLNDLAVQQTFLQAYARKAKSSNPVTMLLALGCLIGRFQERRERLKLQCLKAARRFTNEDTRMLFRRLTAKNPGGGS